MATQDLAVKYALNMGDRLIAITRSIADNNMTALSTGLTESAELVAAGDPIIGSRRVSYIVKVYPDDRPGRYAYTIGTAVQFKRRIERNWFWESADSPVQRQAADALRARIATWRFS